MNGFAATPALENLFEIDGASPLLSEDDKEHFHSVVAKLLFLAKRARPDLLTAVTFLTTRVSAATEEDDVKLGRILKYLNSTADLGMILEGDGAMRVVAYVDASYAVHSDYKSHTGAVIKLGQGTAATKSSKQKINSKSFTEAEIIAVSDALSQIIWVRDFLMAQGYEIGPALLMQDNKSGILMMNRGMSTSERTRHIGTRFFFKRMRLLRPASAGNFSKCGPLHHRSSISWA